MKAIVQDRYGPPEEVLELREVDEPEVGEGEVLVRVCAASLHPDVWQVVTGRPWVFRLVGGLSRPRRAIPGTDMAGVVEAVGGGVTRFRPGDEVFGETVATDRWGHGGAYAERVSVRQDLLATKPGNVTFEQAAAVPTSGFIALMNLRDPYRLRAGQKVLINGAGGGVGSLALQIAKAYGARVTAVDGPGKLDLLRSLGADRVIDYTREDFTRGDARYDLVFDVPGNHPFSVCRRVLEPDGRYVLIGHERFGAVGRPVFGILPYFLRLMLMARFVKQLRGPRVEMPTRSDAMELFRDFLATGKITPAVDRAYPLAELREAFRRLIEGEPRGKVVLTVADAP